MEQNEKKTLTLIVDYPEHGKVELTGCNGDTYTSKSEELIDFLLSSEALSRPNLGEARPFKSVDEPTPPLGADGETDVRYLIREFLKVAPREGDLRLSYLSISGKALTEMDSATCDYYAEMRSKLIKYINTAPLQDTHGDVEINIKDHRIKELTEQCEKYRKYIFCENFTPPMQDTGRSLEECKNEVAKSKGYDSHNDLWEKTNSENYCNYVDFMNEAAEIYAQSQQQPAPQAIDLDPILLKLGTGYNEKNFETIREAMRLLLKASCEQENDMIKRKYADNETCVSSKDYADLVRENLELKKQHLEWISVEDRLPECYGLYMTIRPNSFPFTRWFIHGLWEAGATVTHWMPLPTPPKK